MTVRVLVVDDHPVVRAGLVMVLGIDPDIEVVGEAGDGREAIERAAELEPDVVLTDLQMPEVDGVGVAAQIASTDGGPKVLILTTYDTDRSIVAAVEAGAAGYLLKDTPADEIIEAVKSAAAGHSVLPGPIAEKLAAKQAEPKLPELTERERDVLACVANGSSNAATAKELFISVATVKTHLIHVFQKLQVDDRTSAVTKAIQLGIIEAPS